MSAFAGLCAAATVLLAWMTADLIRIRWGQHKVNQLTRQSRARHPGRVGPPATFWACPACGRQEWSDSPAADFIEHVHVHHRDPVGPEDRPDWGARTSH